MADASTKVPDFFWAQDGNHLYLKIGIVSPENVKTKVTDDTFYFYAEKNKQKYELKFNFRFPTVANNTRHKNTRFAEYVIEKETRNAAWPHLIAKNEIKLFKNRCKVDWDKWLDEDELEESKLNMDFSKFSKMAGSQKKQAIAKQEE